MTCGIGGYKYTNTNVLIVSGKILEPFGGRFAWFSVIWVLWELPWELQVRKVLQSPAKGIIFGGKVAPMSQLWRSLRSQKGHSGPLKASLE